ncbi:MAG: hypothetical protein U0Z26_00960 [Anaerolineales bacterium]
MKQYRMLFVFIALMMAVSLACNAVSAPTAAPTIPPTKVPSQPQPPSGNPPSNNNNNSNGSNSSGGSGLVTFTDKNNLMAFDLPGDWTHVDGSDTNYYYDTFTSPAGDAKIENLVYNDGSPFVASQNGKFALGLLHNIYSSTGKEGDIKITDDSIQGDGSERLTWESKGGGYSGVSFFELRGNDKQTFMMFTAWWNNDVDQATMDVINNAISSYHIP